MPLDHLLRHEDFSLEPEQEALVEVLEKFLHANCQLTDVRSAEPLGYDRAIWEALLGSGILPTTDGEVPRLVECVLSAEVAGRHLAPIPLFEHLALRRLAARGRVGPIMPVANQATAVIGIGLRPVSDSAVELIPVGAIASSVVCHTGDALVVLRRLEPPPQVTNLGSLPIGEWGLGAEAVSAERVATGDDAMREYVLLVRDWRLMAAAYLAGMARTVHEAALDYAKNRKAFGRPLAAFQALSHAIVDVAIAVTGAENLVRKAAWFLDNEPDEAGHLADLAAVAASRAAVKAAGFSVHIHGGIGLAVESDMQLFFRRASAYSALLGSPGSRLAAVGSAVLHTSTGAGAGSA